MRRTDYIDYHFALAMGSDGYDIVNVHGYSNSDVITPGEIKINSDDPKDKMNILIKGLNESYSEIEFDVLLEGKKKISLGEMFRINSIECKDIINDGLITCGDYAINPGSGRAEYAVYTTPASKSCYILSLSSPQDSDIELRVNGISKMMFRGHHKFVIPYRISRASDITFTSTKDSYVNMQMVLIDENILR